MATETTPPARRDATAPRLFVELDLAEGRGVVLPPQVAQHAGRALRLRHGDAVTLFNGRGGEYRGRVHLRGGGGEVAIDRFVAIERENPRATVLLQCLPANEKMDWIVEKATELGVNAIVPLFSQRSIVRVTGDRAERRVVRWRAIAAAACEQCGRNRLPEISNPADLTDYLDKSVLDATKLVLDPSAKAALSTKSVGRSAIVLSGPEGGFVAGEVAASILAGFEACSLGERVLRAETAAIAVLAALQVLPLAGG